MDIQLICSALLIGALDYFRTTVNLHKMQAHTRTQFDKTPSQPGRTLTKPWAKNSKRKLLVPNCMSAGESQPVNCNDGDWLRRLFPPPESQSGMLRPSTLPHRRECEQLFRGKQDSRCLFSCGSECVWAARRRMLINTCYLTIKRHNLGFCGDEKGSSAAFKVWRLLAV